MRFLVRIDVVIPLPIIEGIGKAGIQIVDLHHGLKHLACQVHRCIEHDTRPDIHLYI